MKPEEHLLDPRWTADPASSRRRAPADDVQAVLARYGASRWDMAQGRGSIEGAPADEGEPLRAVADSGCGCGHAMDMLNWVSEHDRAGGAMAPPILRTVNGRRCADHTAPNTWGLWCRRPSPTPGSQPDPRNRLHYQLHDPHFAIVAMSVPGPRHSGIVFQASKAEGVHGVELALRGNHPQARWLDTRASASSSPRQSRSHRACQPCSRSPPVQVSRPCASTGRWPRMPARPWPCRRWRRC